MSDLITRTVKVDRTRSPEDALKATGRSVHVTDSIVSDMPKGEGEETEIVFFTVGSEITDAELEGEYEQRGLRPADPYSLAAVNEADPDFGDKYPNATHWKDKDGKRCFAVFGRWTAGSPFAYVHEVENDWRAEWWFAGIRK